MVNHKQTLADYLGFLIYKTGKKDITKTNMALKETDVVVHLIYLSKEIQLLLNINHINLLKSG